MIARIEPRRLILFFILLTPIVNNLNGFIYWRFGFFSAGPLFYALFLGIVCLALLSLRFEKKVVFNNYLLFFGILTWYAVHTAMYGGMAESLNDYIKFFMPFLVYRFLFLYFGDDRRPILDFLGKTVIIWTGMALVTATLGLKPAAGEGFYGFIHGNNDYVAMLFALYPMVSLWKSRISILLYYLALILTRSKGLFLLGMMMFVQQKSLMIRIFAAVTLFITAVYYINYFKSNFEATEQVNALNMARFLSFGRVHTMMIMFQNLEMKTLVEHVLGSGMKGAFVITEGKGNVEMDIPDVYNIFGFLGLFLVGYFYYYRVAAHPNLPVKVKFNFLPLFALSAMGGHFFFNTVSSVVFTLILFVAGDPRVFAPKAVSTPLPESIAGNVPAKRP